MSGDMGWGWSSSTWVARVCGLFNLLFWPKRGSLLLKRRWGLSGHLSAQWPDCPQ
jgi:hypothetical protein